MNSSYSTSDDDCSVAQMPLQVSTPTKKLKQTLEPIVVDRISDLTDPILIHVLSLIPIKHAIQTAILSKRWVHLWHSLPSLVFRFEETSRDLWKDQDQFISFVDSTLINLNPNYKNNTLQSFCIALDYCGTFDELKLDSWLRFALISNVKELELAVCEYELPTAVWQSDFLTTLKLMQCKVLSYAKVGTCKSLRTLSFTFCDLNGSTLTKVLDGCPALERLELINCWVCDDLHILHERLKEFVVESVYLGEDDDDDDWLFELQLCAPCLKSISITGEGFFTKWRARNLSSLQVAYIDFKCPSAELENVKGVVKDILARLSHVKKLTLGTWCLQVLSSLVATPLALVFSSCKSLVLNTCLESSDLPGLACLLESCPELETLTMDMTRPSSFETLEHGQSSPLDNNGANYWRSQPWYGQHLKTVKVIGLSQNHREVKFAIEFLEYILANARLLKTLSVDTKLSNKSMWGWKFGKGSLLELAQLLLGFPRASPQAVILLT